MFTLFLVSSIVVVAWRLLEQFFQRRLLEHFFSEEASGSPISWRHLEHFFGERNGIICFSEEEVIKRDHIGFWNTFLEEDSGTIFSENAFETLFSGEAFGTFFSKEASGPSISRRHLEHFF